MGRVTCLLLVCMAIAIPGTCNAKNSYPSLPGPLARDSDLLHRYWSWILTETGAPRGLPAPRITVEPLPRSVKMGLFFPTTARPDQSLRVVVAPRTLDRAAAGQRLEVLGELAHELVHYVLLLSENHWDETRDSFSNDVHHHCDPTFQRLTRHIATILWNAYHSSNAVRAIDHMVRKACWEDGHRLAAPG